MTAKLVATAKAAPTWILTAEGQDGAGHKAAGVEVIPLSAQTEAAFMAAVAHTLAARGLTRVMVEGGGQVAAGFLKAGFIDEIHWFRAPRLIGNDGKASVSALGLGRLADTPGYKHRAGLDLGPDTLDIFERL